MSDLLTIVKNRFSSADCIPTSPQFMPHHCTELVGIHHNGFCLVSISSQDDLARFETLCEQFQSLVVDGVSSLSDIACHVKMQTGGSIEPYQTPRHGWMTFFIDNYGVCSVESVDHFVALLDWINTYYCKVELRKQEAQ